MKAPKGSFHSPHHYARCYFFIRSSQLVIYINIMNLCTDNGIYEWSERRRGIHFRLLYQLVKILLYRLSIYKNKNKVPKLQQQQKQLPTARITTQ